MRVETLRFERGGVVLLSLLAPVVAEGADISLELKAETAALAELIRYATAILTPFVSGVILGPEWGAGALPYRTHSCGLLRGLTKETPAVDPMALPPLLPHWGIQSVRGNHAAAYLPLWYHPNEELMLKKRQLVAEYASSCRFEGIDLVLELSTFALSNPDQPQSDPQTIQLQAARDCGRYSQLLALEFPGGALAAATLTAELDCPWIMAERGGDYAVLKDQLRLVLESGAQGMVVGPGLWSGAPRRKRKPAQSIEDHLMNLKRWIKTEGMDRITELTRITQQNQVAV